MEQTLLVAPETPWPPRGSSCELANNANSRKYRKYRKYRLHQSDKIWAYCQGMLCEAQFYSTSLALSAFGVSSPFSCSCFWPKVQRWLRPPDFATVGVSLQTPPSPTIACLQLNCGEIKLSMFQSPNVYADCECLKNHQDMHSRYVCKFVCVCPVRVHKYIDYLNDAQGMRTLYIRTQPAACLLACFAKEPHRGTELSSCKGVPHLSSKQWTEANFCGRTSTCLHVLPKATIWPCLLREQVASGTQQHLFEDQHVSSTHQVPKLCTYHL